ncbi:response regulator [Paenibacillus aurantiacus]|uniref:Response regulator n=1 Tax=Paenibacillus aurantiacus TaxID=1936118 RepID=A0ABV5KRV6_9BACL
MYRLLIVDDEPAIVNGLVQLFQQNKDMELDVCKAYSASEAIEIARKTKLDILISDIRMPQKDGLQLVDEVIYYWPSCRVIFLTGYSEFDYILEAIRKNVQNYILKTEGIEPVFHEVKKAIAKIEESNRYRLEQEKAQMYMQIAEPFMKKELMERMLGGEPLPSLLAQTRYAELDFQIAPSRPFFFLVGQAERLEIHKIKALHAVQRIFDNHAPASIACEKVIYDGSVLVWLIQPAEELWHRFDGKPSGAESKEQGFVAYMKGILELVQNECEEVLDAAVSFGISGSLSGKIDNIHHQVEAARAMIRNRTMLGQKMVIVDLEKTSGSEAARLIGVGMRPDDGKKALIDHIHHYIHEHLADDVSLTAIADEMNFNPSYLSRYYKQITGHNLFDYIQSTKIKVAIHLMKTTSLKLNEIAARAGFDSPSYFTTFFKKMTGQSPQEYRHSQ